jgi:threonyl-tRNA synthetase
LEAVYKLFGFSVHAELSTRPEKFLGEIATWDAAEDVGVPYTIKTQTSNPKSSN